MASQRRFEGADLEEILGRVRRDVGRDARIVAANRVRKGGIGGFFAKEGYEVVVDITGDPRPVPAGVVTDMPLVRESVPASVLDLADEISASEREQVIDLGATNDDDVYVDAPAAAPSVSTETHDFGAMLAQLTAEIDDEPELRTIRTMPAAATTTAPAAAPAPAPASPPPAAPPSAPYDEPPVAPAAHYRRVTSAPAALPEPAAQPVPASRLRNLGLPPEFIPSKAVGGDLRGALVQRLAQLPPPPALPRSPGVIIAVVGIGTAPIALARRIADDLEIDNSSIVLATPEQGSELTHPDEAEALRQSWRRRSQPTVVACSIGAGRAQLGWAHRILDGLEPTAVWAVVEASCKAEDIAHRLRLLGGADVLAITGIADTVSPAAVLRIGMPVARIGAKHATPAEWADLLMERLELSERARQ